MFNKKGVDAIVATVLIIMITVAAVAILWAFVIPMVKNSLASSTEEKAALTIETAGGYTTWDAGNSLLQVQIKRGNDIVNLTGIQFIFTKQGNSTTNISGTISNGSTKIYTFSLTSFGRPEKIAIAPVTAKGVGAIVSETTNIKDYAGQTRVSLGEFCESNQDCASGYCGLSADDQTSRVCTNGADSVDWCSNDNQCASQSCAIYLNYLPYNGICGKNIGEECNSDTQCAFSFAGSTCTSGHCSGQDNGRECGVEADCKNGGCDGRCYTPCSTKEECTDFGGFCGFSDNGNYACTNGAQDKGCFDTTNGCQSGLVCDSDSSSCQPFSGCTNIVDCTWSFDGQFCNTLSGLCTHGILDSPCGNNFGCNVTANLECSSSSHKCMPTVALPRSCTSNTQCTSTGRLCNAYTGCYKPCSSNSDCVGFGGYCGAVPTDDSFMSVISACTTGMPGVGCQDASPEGCVSGSCNPGSGYSYCD